MSMKPAPPLKAVEPAQDPVDQGKAVEDGAVEDEAEEDETEETETEEKTFRKCPFLLQAISKIHLTPNCGAAPYAGLPIAFKHKCGSRAFSKCSHIPMYAAPFFIGSCFIRLWRACP